ncbi:hypothetical protein FQA39_LY12441 [Lamprigera yunnana]|nr:hypothetical protein FQA39_LY12441 [Lamprigera yunnana]
MSESAYNSPMLNRRLTESCCSSPARSVGQQTPEVLTDSDGDGEYPLHTESPGVPDQTVISGWLKFRDNKKKLTCCRSTHGDEEIESSYEEYLGSDTRPGFERPKSDSFGRNLDSIMIANWGL